MKRTRREITNLERLEAYLRRSPFHDEEILEVLSLNKRIVIRLVDRTLVITGAAMLERCETPALWIAESIVPKAVGFGIEVETDRGRLRADGADVRLIRNSDLAMLVPPIDD